MKNKIMIVSIVLIAMLGLAACTGASSTQASQPETRTITVNGNGKVVLSPDMATINIGVQTQSDDAEKASAENTQQVNAIMAALADFEIADNDIKTTNFSIYPRQNYNDQNEVTSITYIVSNSILVTVRDLNVLGDVLNAAIGAGANNINGITFDLSDRESANAQAMEAAMQNAAARADVLAQASNTKIVQVQSVTTYIGGGGIQKQYAADTSLSAEMAAGASVPVSPGDLEIDVEVSVVYEIN